MPEPEPEELPIEVLRAELAKAPPPIPDVGFGNPQAVRIGLLVAVLSLFASGLTVPIAILPFLCMVGAGFLSVYLYRRRTGQSLSLGSGARMGWMTGMFAFLILLVLLTTVVWAVSDQTFASRMVEEIRARGMSGDPEKFLEVFRTPAGIVQILLVYFVFFTLFPTVGGVLGAKFFSARSR